MRSAVAMSPDVSATARCGQDRGTRPHAFEGPIEQRGRRGGVAELSSHFGRAQPRVGDHLLLANRTRHAEPVALSRIGERRDDELGLGFERALIGCLLPAVLCEPLECGSGAVASASVEVHGRLDKIRRLFGLALLRQEIGEKEQQEGAPGWVGFELGPRFRRLDAQSRIVRASGEDLELEPGVASDGRSVVACNSDTRRSVVLAVVGEKRSPLHQRASLFDRRLRDAQQRVEKLRKVLHRLSSFEQPHETLERLAKLCVRIESRQKLASGFHLLAAAFFDHPELVQEKRFLLRVGRALLLRPQIDRRNVRRRVAGRNACRMTRRARGIRHTRAVQCFRCRTRAADQADACQVT
jgi:hypothetical protein